MHLGQRRRKKLYNILCKYRECFPSVRDAVHCLWIVFIISVNVVL